MCEAISVVVSRVPRLDPEGKPCAWPRVAEAVNPCTWVKPRVAEAVNPCTWVKPRVAEAVNPCTWVKPRVAEAVNPWHP